MADFPIPDNPTFSNALRMLETTDKAHADVFNAVFKVLFENELALKKKAEENNVSSKRIINVNVTKDDWVDDSTFPEYPYRTNIKVDGIDGVSWMCSNAYVSDVSRTLLYPEVNTGENMVSVWIKEKPDHSILFESFDFTKVV